MREKASVVLGLLFLLVVALACKSGSGGTTTTSSSASASAAPTKPWIDQAQSAWPDAKIEDVANDAGMHAARIKLTMTRAPKPSELATHMQALLALEGANRPCAINVSGDSDEKDDAGKAMSLFVGHIVVEQSVAYSALTPLEVAKRMVERTEEDMSQAFRCVTATWFMTTPSHHFMRDWRAYVREYSNVWDGSEKDALEAEKICERAADLELFKGETFPDATDTIESGVHFPKMSSQTIKWRSYAEFKSSKDWFDCQVNANEPPKITWDHKRE